MADVISLWKAPHAGTGQRQLKEGFQPVDYPGFPGEVPDGNAYFSLSRELAKEYADCYGEGIIEAQVARSDYERFFKVFEESYQGGELVQVAIPNTKLSLLNALTIERIHHGA